MKPFTLWINPIKTWYLNGDKHIHALHSSLEKENDLWVFLKNSRDYPNTLFMHFMHDKVMFTQEGGYEIT